MKFCAVCRVFLVFLLAFTALAQVNITAPANGQYHVEIDGKPFGDLYTSSDLPKPFFSPLRTATGKIVTREWPMVPDSGTTRDHQHHRGMWFGYLDVNGVNFWENEISYHRANAGRIAARSVKIVRTGGKTGVVHAVFDWLTPSGSKIFTEDRTMTFGSEPELRIVDTDITLMAAVRAVFADDKDGAFGIRMADVLTEIQGGVITNSLGQRTAKEVWGNRADWCDYTGKLNGERAGLVIFDHPESFHHPARWHARDYGLIAANPFADHAFDPSAAARHVTLDPGQMLRLRYRVIVHGDIDRATIEKLYKRYASEK